MTIIIVSKQEGFRRAGVAHSEKPASYPDDHFTKEQLDNLEAEPMLRVSHVEDHEPDPITEDAIVAAIHQMKPMDGTQWTSDGKPQLPALEALLQGKVTAKERDTAWERYQKENK
jgi:hypothetical protein